MKIPELSDDDIQIIITSINDHVEVPLEVLKKLSPSFFEKLSNESRFDFNKLEKFKIPTIEYAGKRSETQILTQVNITGGNAPLEIQRCFNCVEKSEDKDDFDLFMEISSNKLADRKWINLIVQGDNLQFLKTCFVNKDPLIKNKVKGKVKLIYIDPPFATKSEFSGKSGEASYSDKIDRAEFLEALRERLLFLREMLDDEGSIYLHLDYRSVHYVKPIMDELFGKNNFLNEIIWYYESGGRSENFFSKKHEVILFYAKNATKYYFSTDEIGSPRNQCVLCGQKMDKWNNLKKHIDENGRIFRSIVSNGKRYIYYDDEIIPPPDVWLDINHLQQKDPERQNYPTQKPEELVKRIILSSSKPGDLILDVFAGSGTTSAVAEKLNRRWIVCDFGKHSIYTIQKRLLDIANSNSLDNEQPKNYNQKANPFCVVSVGAYDFSKIMRLRENKNIYIQFVCGLFNISHIDLKLSDKYHIENIFAEKSGDPVEVFPVWNDDFLYNIRIDKEYLQGIVYQSQGKLSGNYYIITPETCTTIGNTEIKNNRGGNVQFHILSFPYKVLEEFARTRQIQEQPSSPNEVNNLINSVGFYFNESVQAQVELIENKIRISQFETDALNKDGHRFEGLDGLSLILVDENYDNNVFKISKAIYADDLGEDGTTYLGDIIGDIGVILIDKHGNESDVKVVRKNSGNFNR